MSYDIYLVNPVNGEKLILPAPHFIRGGTYCVEGTREAHLNITYNYGEHYRRVFGDADAHLTEYQKLFGGGYTGIRKIYGMTGAESIPVLKKAADMLKDDIDEDYWKPTEGNARQALLQLIALAQMRPDGVWEGD